ncbi:unnamed protein product [Schistocephalus solidus]|uniref:Dilute domain-containing protein n=1 Tax=Schistocephalus solidus TaxID=70667 RepID=A0A183SN09_SCHSO|nr:unnamed protein product [Schistocephalus solidus]
MVLFTYTYAPTSPLTTMDSDQLSSPESSLRIAGHFYRTADDHSDLNSVGSRRSQASNQDYNQTFSSTSFASSLETGEYSDVHVLPIESQSKFSERRKEKLEDGQPMTYQDVSSAESSVIYENAKEVSHFDESSLGHIVEQLREQLEYLSRTPCRYTQVLLATSDSLERLCEFMVSDENREDDPQIAVDSLSRTKNHETHSDKALEGLSQDPTEALCMLDTAVDFAQSAINNYLTEPPLTVGSDRRVQAQPSISSFNSFDDSAAALHTSMTSGWTELDDVIRWHLQNIRQLLSGLSSSPEIFGMLNDPSGGAGSNGSPHGTLKTSENFLPAEILVALAGVVNYYAETQNHCQTVSNTNCLDYGGTRSNSLLPKDFWRLVWGQEAESISRSRNSLHRLSAYSTQSTISLLLPRQKLLEYFFSLCRDGCHFTDEDDVLQAAMEDLLDQMTDADITDHSWAYIPLTQLCLRLRPSTLVMAASTLKPSGIPNHAGRSPVFRPGSAQRQDLALFNILRYIRSQITARSHPVLIVNPKSVQPASEDHAPLHVLLRHGVKSAVVREEQVMDCSCRHMCWGLHKPTVEKVPVTSVGDADPRGLFTFYEADTLARADNCVSRELLSSWFFGPQSINKRNDLAAPYSVLRFCPGRMRVTSSPGDIEPNGRGIVTPGINNREEITAISDSGMDQEAIIASTLTLSDEHEDCQR